MKPFKYCNVSLKQCYTTLELSNNQVNTAEWGGYFEGITKQLQLWSVDINFWWNDIASGDNSVQKIKQNFNRKSIFTSTFWRFVLSNKVLLEFYYLPLHLPFFTICKVQHYISRWNDIKIKRNQTQWMIFWWRIFMRKMMKVLLNRMI